jgi:hypothetical protein
METKRQILFIHGGSAYENMEDFYEYLHTTPINLIKEKKWTELLKINLGENYDVIFPTMPIKHNANYMAWKIWFERHFKFINEEVILIGHSLGGTFLLKYLSENNFSKKILQLHLIAPAVFDDGLTSEKLLTFGFDVTKINTIYNICSDIHLWASRDDDCVTFKNSEIVKENLPSIEFHILENRGHFNSSEFPEILEVIKKAK